MVSIALVTEGAIVALELRSRCLAAVEAIAKDVLEIAEVGT